MTICFGTNPIAWSNDDMQELGGATPLTRCLEEARAAGFVGIELGHKFPREEALLRPILEAQGLALVSGWHSTHLLTQSVGEERAALAPHLALLKAMGSPVVIVAETSGAVHSERAVSLAKRPKLASGDWQDFTTKLGELARLVADAGLKLVYHHHMGTVIEQEEEIDRLMQQTPEVVGLLLDTGHASFAGADPAVLAARYASRIGHVHCKDLRRPVADKALREGMSFLDAVVAGVFTVPGDGSVDFPAVLAPLAEAGYDGWLVVEAEQDPDKADPFTYAKLGYENLRDFARKASFQF